MEDFEVNFIFSKIENLILFESVSKINSDIFKGSGRF